MYVHQLFSPSYGSWNIGILFNLFAATAARCILNISIHQNFEDTLIWTLEKNGISLWSLHIGNVWEITHNSSVSQIIQRIYKKQWKLHTLPRINQFLWKCIKNILRTRDKLASVIPNMYISFPFCSQSSESSCHIIMSWIVSKFIWFPVLGLQLDYNLNLTEWIGERFDKLLINQITEVVLSKTIIKVWSTSQLGAIRSFKRVTLFLKR